MNKLTTLFLFTLLLWGCKKNEYQVPAPKDMLQNDAIKRTIGPAIAGENLYFAYAIAIPASKGKIVAAQVEASIPGSTETYIDNKSYYTNPLGSAEVGILVADPSSNNNSITSIHLNKDTNAVTFRYYYRIPPEAKGKEVSFKFSASASNGDKITYNLGPYKISNMDMVKTITVTDPSKPYISIADMKAYTAAEVAAMPEKVDLIYSFRNIPASRFFHTMVAPAATPVYLQGAAVPAGAVNNTSIIKDFGLNDFNLSTVASTYYYAVDDADFQKLDMSTAAATNYAVDLKKESSLWVETADKKYRAFIYVNTTTDASKTAIVGMKRYTMK